MRGAPPPRAIDVRLLTPRNHWFGLRHERARCELEESSRQQDGGCRALRIEPFRSKTNREKKETGRRAMLEDMARHSGDDMRGGEEAWRQVGNEGATIRHSRL
ncbi:hypothetical protein NDU88_006496 [Pleurodeles waltl]|uniref:Uncharacterized protein n=1 Tax=Pleurodeles waltl TaxID=8319 RepID=A0AAV7M0C7_PLEWA|nr:hypothetical protein NDU88_006496 [Pleurodeles waltl]